MEFKDKLENAAENHAKVMGDIPAINSIHAFTSGAKWLMEQPLADRLNPDEVDMIRARYAKLTSLKGHMAGIVDQMMFLDRIFGKEMFSKE